MIILPYNTELRLSQRPYVVYAVIVVCFIVFYFQQENRKEISQTIGAYCENIYAPNIESDKFDYMRGDKEACSYFLLLMHFGPELDGWVDYNLKIFKDKYTRAELEKYAVFELKYYRELLKSTALPEDLDKKLMYYPDTFNPFKMLTSAVSHADWSHIIFNLLFFFAFAPALEVIIGSKLKFFGVLVAIEVIGGVMYSFASIIDGTNIPTLGLSGSVAGMIGLSAYLMPWARIRTVFLFLAFARVFSIPAWYLAAWYIGWDVYELFSRTSNGGVNVLAHVAGGLSGYFIGMLFFKEKRDEAKYELGVEIDYMQSKRNAISSLGTTYKGDTFYVDSKQKEHEAKKSFAKYIEELYRFDRAGEISAAIAHSIKHYDMYEKSPEIYQELFQEAGEWKKKRFYLCMGRLVINLYIEQKKTGKIPAVLEACLDVDENFVLADPSNLLFIAHELLSMHQPELAYRLLKDAKTKYGEYINECDCVVLEAKILWEYLGKEAEAKLLLEQAIRTAVEKDKAKIRELLGLMKTS